MDNSNTNFYLSGVISLSLFSLCAFLFVFVLSKPSMSNIYGIKKDNYISISIEVPKMKSSTAKKNVTSKVVTQKTDMPSKDIDINNLFSKVWTKKIAPKNDKPKPIDNKRLFAIKKKIKISQVNETQDIGKTINNMDNVKSNKETESSATAERVNEYLAKIQAVVYHYFQPPPNSAGSSVKTVIELNALGKVQDFRILEYSNNEALNHEADKIKNRLMHIIFPINPQNRPTRTVVVLISKE